jgi:photosystem II stability/assembly factor-like uncharacterized protein
MSQYTKSILGTTAIVAVLALAGIVFSNNDAQVKMKKGEDPGYFAQWYEMKKDPNGNIPMGMGTKWLHHDRTVLRNSSRRDNPIESVEELGPTTVGGRTRAVLVDMDNDNRIFAGAISGGLWYSGDKGSTWEPLNDAAVNLTVSCITQNPFDHDEMYYGTGESRGATHGVPGDGVFKSTDGGVTFDQIPSTANDTFSAIWSIHHSEKDANTIYIGTNNFGGLRSTDGGQTWEMLMTAKSSVTDIEVFADGSVILAIKGNGLHRSPDGTPNTFVKIPNSAVSGGGRIEVEKCDGFQNVVYAAYEKYNDALSGFFKSSDGGITWNATPSIPNIRDVQQTYCIILGVHPTDTNKVYCAGVTAKYSKNGGASWATPRGSHADHHSFAYFHGNKDMFLDGNDGGVYTYNWNTIASTSVDNNKGYNVVQFYGGNCYPTGKSILAGTQDNGSHRIVNGIHRKMYGADGAMSHVSFQNEDLGYIETQNGGIRRTTNLTALSPSFLYIGGGIGDAKNFISQYEMNLADGRMLFFLTTQGLWRTLNTGSYWMKVANYTPSCFGLTMTEQENPTVFWGGISGRFYRLKNAKNVNSDQEFDDLRLTIPFDIRLNTIGGLSVHPTDTNVIFAGMTNFGDAPKAYRVEEVMADTPVWHDISGDLPIGLPVNSIVADPEAPDRIYFAGTDFGLYYTDNSGQNWHKVNNVPNVSIHQMRLRKSDRGLFLFTHGRGIWYLKLKGGVAGTPEPEDQLNVSVYPNPSSSVVNVDLPKSVSKVEYAKVYNLSGKLVFDGKFEDNGGTKSFDVSQWSVGMYIISVKTDKGVYNSKFAVTR